MKKYFIILSAMFFFLLVSITVRCQDTKQKTDTKESEAKVAPPLPLPGMEKAFLGAAPSIFSGPLRVGADGDFLTLPAGLNDIKVSRRF